MKELIDASFSSVNVFPTILFAVIILYWVFVVIGALDLDFLNFDVDTGDVDVGMDADTEVDIDADFDTNVDTETEIESEVESNTEAIISLNSVLSFFNIGKVPFMILMSFFTLSVWMISISTNYIFHNHSVIISILLLIPNMIVSLFVSKIITTPFAIIYTKMAKNNEDNFEYQGKICTVIMTASHEKMGQAEINDDGSTFRINVKTKDKTTLEKGETGLIINYIPEQKCYLVEPYKI